MSGICGIFDRNGGPAAATQISAMLDAMRHRGPDGRAIWQDGAVALGHSMLHTTPESLGERLPQATADRAFAITADARIDNRHELFAQLDSSRQPLASDSD